jgi:hypothetical protein
MLVTLPNLILELQHAPLPLKVLRVRERASMPCFFRCFQFGLTFESVKELGSASKVIINVKNMNESIFKSNPSCETQFDYSIYLLIMDKLKT